MPAVPSGTRPLLSANWAGDQLVITKLDRLGPVPAVPDRAVPAAEGQGVGLVVLDQGIDTSPLWGRMFFRIRWAVPLGPMHRCAVGPGCV
ncbi:MAG: hypothetical protein M3O70_25085 [Actinomycetota bacterium]|nr:hypothetical protein [Actinomycetota bacterium]